MSTSFKVLPSDYTGVVGSTMPVRAELQGATPVGGVETYNVELFDNSGASQDTQVVVGGEYYLGFTNNFDLSDWDELIGTLSIVDGNLTLSGSTRDMLAVLNTISLQAPFVHKYVAITHNNLTNAYGDFRAGDTSRFSGFAYQDEQLQLYVVSDGVLELWDTGSIPQAGGLLDVTTTLARDGTVTCEYILYGSDHVSAINADTHVFSSRLTTDTPYSFYIRNHTEYSSQQYEHYSVKKIAEYIYDAPNMQVSDSGEWKLVADGAVEAPFNVAIIAEGANTVSQGGVSVEVLTLEGNGVDIALDMGRGVDSRGLVQWLDNGKGYDRYKNSLTIRTDSPSQFEALMNSDSVDTMIITTPTKDAYFPFGMGFATQQNYPVNVNTWNIDEETYFGEVKEYSLTTFPNVRDIYSSLVESTTLSGCVLDHWQIAGIPFPYTRPKNEHNEMRFVSVGHGDSYQVVDPTRPYGEVAECSIEVEEEQARQILQFFTKVMRGTEQTATFPASYNLFSRRYEGLTTATVKLFSNVVNVLHVSQGRVEINFSLQIVGV